MTTTRPRLQRGLILLVAVLLVATACGGDGALAEQTCSAATAVGITCELLPHDQGHMLPTHDLTATWDRIDEFLRRELQIPS